MPKLKAHTRKAIKDHIDAMPMGIPANLDLSVRGMASNGRILTNSEAATLVTYCNRNNIAVAFEEEEEVEQLTLAETLRYKLYTFAAARQGTGFESEQDAYVVASTKKELLLSPRTYERLIEYAYTHKLITKAQYDAATTKLQDAQYA